MGIGNRPEAPRICGLPGRRLPALGWHRSKSTLDKQSSGLRTPSFQAWTGDGLEAIANPVYGVKGSDVGEPFRSPSYPCRSVIGSFGSSHGSVPPCDAHRDEGPVVSSRNLL